MNSTSICQSSAGSVYRIPQTLLLLVATSFIFGTAAAQVTIGESLIDRAANDGASGGVYIYTDTFGLAGTVDTWGFYDNDAGVKNITPLLFQKINSTTFQLTAVGTTVQSTNGGVQTDIAFGLILGSTAVGSDYTFGFTDRDVSYGGSGSNLTTNSTNSGVADFDSTGIWAFTPSSEGNFDLILGQNFEIGAAQGGDDLTVGLFASTDRTYSAQFTISAVPEPAAAGLLISLLTLSVLSLRRRPRKPYHRSFGV